MKKATDTTERGNSYPAENQFFHQVPNALIAAVYRKESRETEKQTLQRKVTAVYTDTKEKGR